MKNWYSNLNKKSRCFILGIEVVIVIFFVMLFALSNGTMPALSALFAVISITSFAICLYTIKLEEYLKKQTTNAENSKVESWNLNPNTIALDVKIIDIEGCEKYLPDYYKITDNKHCLYCRGGKTYHTHVGCYKNWDNNMRQAFTHWETMTIDDAEAKGLKKCAFCEYNSLSIEEKISKKLNSKEHVIIQLIGNKGIEMQENLSCVSELDDVEIEFDFEKDRYAVTDNVCNRIGFIKKSDMINLEKYGASVEELRGFVFSIDEDDNLKYTVKVAIFID